MNNPIQCPNCQQAAHFLPLGYGWSQCSACNFRMQMQIPSPPVSTAKGGSGYGKGTIMAVLGGVALLLVVAATRGSSPSSTNSTTMASQQAEPSEPEPPKAAEISIAEYSTAYDSNEIAANERYEGKLLTFAATVESVSKTLGTVGVHFEGPFLASPFCSGVVDDSPVAPVDLAAGMRVRVVGTGAGTTLGAPAFHDCSISAR